MEYLNSTAIIFILCGIVILSYFFSLLSLKTRVPSVILLLATGIIIKEVLLQFGIQYELPKAIIELFGTIGLIMILLEAGLDLKINKERVSLIRNSLFAALFIMFLSVVPVALIIKYWLNEPLLNSFVYALPLSIISGAIVIPSVEHLTVQKRDFLVYEASFSDILGILFFNFIITEHALSFFNFSLFFINVIFAVIIALIVSFFLFYLITRSKVNARFFLVFSILILLYVSGKLINLPSLIIILIFGLMVSNWEEIKYKKLLNIFPHQQIENIKELLHSITAESSFLIRTFFFILFGYSININLFTNIEVISIGSAIVAVMMLVRYVYLKIFVKSNIFPELFYMPGGLLPYFFSIKYQQVSNCQLLMKVFCSLLFLLQVLL
jgi:NhaP-type Na+/H+ or K+/H+ antiporter